MQPIIKMQDIVKIYRAGEVETVILRGINLEVFPNEMLAIMGASGSGKTTLMNIIGLLDKPSSGEYLLNGKNVSSLQDNEFADLRNKMIGFVFQSFFLLPRLTIKENVALPLYYRQYDATKSNALAEKMLMRVGLEQLVDRKPGQLSGGQQQRAAIARALVGSPTFILADEPTGALDTKIGQMIMDIFLELNNKEKVTIIIITHDPHIAHQCQRTLHIKDGLIE